MTQPMMTLAEAAALLPGSCLVGDGALPFARVHTDTRTLAPGDLFVALKGERFDAHAFLPQARAAGAVAAIAQHGLAQTGLPGLWVDDTLAALQQLAAAWRRRRTLTLIGVVGSNGKTTVTQMIGCILRAAYGEAALATAGNLNNHIGVPLTLLRLRGHAAAVIEMGMNHPGEIAALAALAQPTVALVNNAQREHLEFMHSVTAVARENGSVIGALPADGVAVFAADDEHTPLWREMAGARRTITFGLDEPDAADAVVADVTASAQWQADHWRVDLRTPAGPVAVALHMAGRHNVKNAAAATAAALAAGVPLVAVAAGLSAFRAVKGRCQAHALQRGGCLQTLIDDSYNANPDSVRAAVDVLAALPAPRWLVLGDMGEVGDEGPHLHSQAGAYAQRCGIETVWCVGDLARHAAAACGGRHFDSVAQLLETLGQTLGTPTAAPARATAVPPFASVLVKGSRFMRMEQVVAALQECFSAREEPSCC